MAVHAQFLPYSRLQMLLDVLQQAGYGCVGPVVKDQAIVYQPISHINDLPRGVKVAQQPGSYRLQHSDSAEYFAWVNGPQALKPLTFKAEQPLWRSQRNAQGELLFTEVNPVPEKIAVIGARACDLAALYIQDKHFLQSSYVDPYYRAARQELFIVAVNCTVAADTCFCVSTGDGPQVSYGYDLALTEIAEGFVLQAHSELGQHLSAGMALTAANTQQLQQAENSIAQAAQQQSRRLPGQQLATTLMQQLDHPQWQKIGERCLACGNCTAVCPTCFCHSESDRGDLTLGQSEHLRQWDSCFTQGHSYIHGITLRDSTASRYRQWLTHKLGSWHEQYGRSGCVGCGRCISWCPVAIDITTEVNLICGEVEHD